MINRKTAARRKLLSILPRRILEELSQNDRPHMLTKTELISLAADKWDEDIMDHHLASLLRSAN